MIRIACCQYEIETMSDWQSYIAKIEKIVVDAKSKGATILLLPEYAGIEIACKKFATDTELFIALQPLMPKYIDFYKQLAKNYQIYIQPGTIIESIASDQYVNRAYFFSPNGSYEHQDKLQLTEAEKSIKLLQHGNEQKLFDTSIGKIGIAICYDSEFPEIIRNLVLQGASIILVPSYTTTLAGYNRVFLACRARAIENQCYTAIAYAINKVDISDEAEETYGRAAILGPADIGFPDDGIISQGTMNIPMMIVGDISISALDLVRKEGNVHNFEDTIRFVLSESNKIRLTIIDHF